MKRIVRYVLVASLMSSQLLAMPQALAWSDLGHMAVAYLAYKKLDQKTKARVDELLKLNPYYKKWKHEIKESGVKDEFGAQVFMLAATFPDLIKKDKTYESDGSEAGNKPDGEFASRNIGYSDHLMHKYWHFYDLPFASDKSRLPEIPAPNALTQIAAFRKVLASDEASDDLKSYDLCWLLHIVGDVHQPLHCTTRVSKNAPYGDNGGNDVFVLYTGDKSRFLTFDGKDKKRFHWFWDSCLGISGMPEAIKLADSLAEAKAGAGDIDEYHWIKESFALAKQKLYSSPVKSGNGPFALTPQYEKMAISLSKKRVALAACRLAKILNKELK